MQFVDETVDGAAVESVWRKSQESHCESVSAHRSSHTGRAGNHGLQAAVPRPVMIAIQNTAMPDSLYIQTITFHCTG